MFFFVFSFFLSLPPSLSPQAPVEHKYLVSAMWGELSCAILNQNFDSAHKELVRLREEIEQASTTSSLMKLQQRSWLIHWSLFVYFNHQNGPDDIINVFLHQQEWVWFWVWFGWFFVLQSVTQGEFVKWKVFCTFVLLRNCL